MNDPHCGAAAVMGRLAERLAAEKLLSPVKGIQAGIAANPEPTLTVFVNRPHKIVAQAVGGIRVVLIAGDRAAFRIERIQPCPHGADPERSRMILT